MRKFTYNDIDELDPKNFWFECAMVSACSPVFDHCEDNHDVEAQLRGAKVLLPKNQTDTECCALVVNFSSRQSGEKFIDRLNEYLESRL